MQHDSDFQNSGKNGESLLEKLLAYEKEDIYPFHMPGHKRNKEYQGLPFEMDITEITGFDNLHHAEGILKAAQERAAFLYGVKESFFSINGSSACLLSAISAAFQKGDKVLAARNCHKSVYHAIYLRELVPVYIYPEEIPPEMTGGILLNGGISPEKVEKALREDSRIRGMILTSPTYDGVVSDIGAIAECLHKRGLPLIVDEAHGAHFIFSDRFPVSAVRMGADVVVHSVHKTLPSLTQTALIHRCTCRIDCERLKRFLSIYQTSSPSYILMASLDSCIRLLENRGREMFKAYTARLEKARERLSRGKRIRLVTPEISRSSAVFGFDPSRLLLSTAGTALTGDDLFHLLREKYHLEMEMEAPDYVLALSGAGDTAEGFERLCCAIEEIDNRLGTEPGARARTRTEAEEEIRGRTKTEAEEKTEVRTKAEAEEKTEVRTKAEAEGKTEIRAEADTGTVYGKAGERCMEISEALEGKQISCPLLECGGRISGEFVYLYPPGVPFIVPGERIPPELPAELLKLREKGFSLQGMEDYSGKSLRVMSGKRSETEPFPTRKNGAEECRESGLRNKDAMAGQSGDDQKPVQFTIKGRRNRMGKIFYLMGKSASGKDSMYERIMDFFQGRLLPLIIYSTRPIRDGEVNGREYYFVDEETLSRMRSEGRVIEERMYQTTMGPWYYFTADTENISPDHDYLGIGTPESFRKLSSYFGPERVCPIYIEVEDGERLIRAIRREQKQEQQDYPEMCRRFLSDNQDFSEENLKKAGIVRRFRNHDREACLREILEYIQENLD